MKKSNRTIDVIRSIYKPYRYTIKGNTTVLETTSGKFLVKEKSSTNIKNIYNYLLSRSFDNFPNLIDGDREELNVFEYIEDIPTPKEQKAQDLINLITNLHNKTTYYKEVTEDIYKEIYENISNNLEYASIKYNEYFGKILTEEFMSPSHYLLIRNSSKIFAAIDFGKRELDAWYAIVKEKKKQRVSLIHNNLSLEHMIKGNKDYLISWEKSKTDSPVMDIINFYKNEYFEIDFDTLFHKYLEKYPLTDDEKKLLFIILAIPPELKVGKCEMINTKSISKMLDFVYKTEELIRPYYTSEEPK